MVQPEPSRTLGNLKSYKSIKVREIGKNLLVFGANVCTISENQQMRRVKLKSEIGTIQPDVVLLVETNLSTNWNPYPKLYESFRTIDSINCGVLILIKRQLKPQQIDCWSNKGLCVELVTLNIFIIGLYTPNFTDVNFGKQLLEKWTKNRRWLVFADHERYVHSCASLGKYIFIPSFSRSCKGKFTCTDGMYGNLKLVNKRLGYQISDHYLLTCEVYLGLTIHYQNKKQYKRNDIIHWATMPTSILRKKILLQWPETPMSELIPTLVRKRKFKKVIWVPQLNRSASLYDFKQFNKNNWAQIEGQILQNIIENKMDKLALIMRKFVIIKSNANPILGTTNEIGARLIGDQADRCFLTFYESLFSKNNKALLYPKSDDSINQNSDDLCKPRLFKNFEICSTDIIKKIAQHKSLSIDCFPDELLHDNSILQKLVAWTNSKFNGAQIENIYNRGKLILLNKSYAEYPKPEETRPIVVLSAVRKFLEIAWYRRYSDIIWKQIGPWQIGFRPGHSTQENIIKLCNWLDSNSKGAIGLFIDVRKAFDNIDRNQVLKLVKNSGVDEIGIKILYNLLDKMKLEYKEKEIIYNIGVPQGSVLSPLLFNLVYDVILKEANENGWMVLAYADDLFIGITTKDEYENVLKWLDLWKVKVNLQINDQKTKEFHIGKFDKMQGRYESVDNFTYLGVNIPKLRKSRSSKKQCSKAITSSANLYRTMRGIHHRANSLCLLWWMISNALYQTIHCVVCGYCSIEFIRIEIIKKIRKISKTPSRMPNILLEQFLGFNLRNTISKITTKIDKNLGITTITSKCYDNPYARIWNKTIAFKQISPKKFTLWISSFAWKGEKKLKCKICHKFISLIHLKKHRLISNDTYDFLTICSFGSLYSALENLGNFPDQISDTINSILMECEIKWDSLISRLSYIDKSDN